jgi:hypothetical protein
MSVSSRDQEENLRDALSSCKRVVLRVHSPRAPPHGTGTLVQVQVPYCTIPVLVFLLCHVIYTNSCEKTAGNSQNPSHGIIPKLPVLLPVLLLKYMCLSQRQNTGMSHAKNSYKLREKHLLLKNPRRIQTVETVGQHQRASTLLPFATCSFHRGCQYSLVSRLESRLKSPQVTHCAMQRR